MKLFLKKFSVLIVSFVFVTTALSYAGFFFLRQSNFYKPSFLTNAVNQEEFDYIILGASNGLTTLNTSVIDSMLLTEGINLSVDDTAVSSQYLMLQHFLAEGKRAKYCILASSPYSFDAINNAVNDNDYRFLMYVNRPYVSDYYKQFSERRARLMYYSKWIPALGMSYYNAELFYPSLISIVNPTKRNRFDENGNYGYPFVKTKAEDIINFEYVEIRFSNIFVKKIKDLCNANDIKLICYISPIQSTAAITNNSDYDVINHSNQLLNTKYFNDEIHVNALGRKASSINFSLDYSNFIKNRD
jgi:hypothetical protein